MTRVVVTQLDGGGFVATRAGTPTLVVFGLTVDVARTKAARQLRSWRRYQRGGN